VRVTNVYVTAAFQKFVTSLLFCLFIDGCHIVDVMALVGLHPMVSNLRKRDD